MIIYTTVHFMGVIKRGQVRHTHKFTLMERD